MQIFLSFSPIWGNLDRILLQFPATYNLSPLAFPFLFIFHYSQETVNPFIVELPFMGIAKKLATKNFAIE